MDLCLLYGDFNRPVFLEAFLRFFVDSASPAELKALRRAIAARAKSFPRKGQRGRPRAQHDAAWLRRALQLAWQREILGWSWRRVALAAGIRPTKGNLRTLENRCDRYATLVWSAAMGRAGQPERLQHLLGSRKVQRWFASRLALPFPTHPEESKKIVLALAARGLQVAANALGRKR